MREIELGAFLRSRREALKPGEVGLPAGNRRRTPGLRRTEVATLAGISVEYLTRLEQGRDRNPSIQVLGALAEALRLTTGERHHLHNAVKAASGGRCLESPLTRTVQPGVRALLDRLDPTPAVVLNRLGDVLAHSDGFRQLVAPLGLLDPDYGNVPRFVFGHPRAKAAFDDWDRVADEWGSLLKTETMRGDEATAEFLNELALVGGAPFTARLAAPASPQRPAVTRWNHPRVGPLRLEPVVFAVAEAEDQRLVAYLPADDASANALAGLARTELRAVGAR